MYQELKDKKARLAVIGLGYVGLPIALAFAKKIKVIVPANYTGKVYGVVAQYKESEKWKDNGSLEVIVSVPSGMLMEFFDKLNKVTHGTAISEEIKD